MNKQSWRAQKWRSGRSTPLIGELLDDCFAADVALKTEGEPVFFRGQPVTRELLITRLREEVARCGIDEDELGVAFTLRSNAFSTWASRCLCLLHTVESTGQKVFNRGISTSARRARQCRAASPATANAYAS